MCVCACGVFFSLVVMLSLAIGKHSQGIAQSRPQFCVCMLLQVGLAQPSPPPPSPANTDMMVVLVCFVTSTA